MKLNPEQKLAVSHFNGPCIVTAVPGSGKTTALASRVICLIKERGISPRNVLCLTFTNKSASEMKERIAKQIGKLSDNLWIGTFHKLCLAILRRFHKEAELSENFTIYNNKDQEDLLKKLARMEEYECNDYVIKAIAKSANDFREDLTNFEDHISELKPIEVDIINSYLKTIKEFEAVDFSGMLYEAWKLLDHNQKIRAIMNKRFKYVLVDEGQDTNNIQFSIIKMLAEHTNLFVVADKNQSIYQFRGAKPENLDKLKEYYKDCKEIVLPRNYRSTKQILKAAQSVINNNHDAGEVKLISERGSGNNIKVVSCPNPEEEAEWVIGEIHKIKHAYDIPNSEIAVLYRTNNLSKVPEMKFKESDIPYKVMGGFSFFDRKEIKTALAYLSFMANPKDTISFARAIAYPTRKVGNTTIGKLEKYCKDNKVDIMQACKNIDSISKVNSSTKKSVNSFIDTIEKCGKKSDLFEQAKSVLHETGFYGILQKEADIDSASQRRVLNVDEFLSGIDDFNKKNKGATLAQYLQSIQILASQDEEKEEDTVTLMTQHAAKGLEFQAVFVIGTEEGYMPHNKSIIENRVEEERRLFYVSMTRAKDLLHISHCYYRKKYDFARRRFDFVPQEPSRFLSEI